jgi:biopolymer transport protein TolR
VIQIIIGKDERIELKVREKTSAQALKGLAAAVKQAQIGETNSVVVISADKNIRYETVVSVMDKLQRAGIQRVGLSVQLVN